jgi:hypothetical protein
MVVCIAHASHSKNEFGKSKWLFTMNTGWGNGQLTCWKSDRSRMEGRGWSWFNPRIRFSCVSSDLEAIGHRQSQMSLKLGCIRRLLISSLQCPILVHCGGLLWRCESIHVKIEKLPQKHPKGIWTSFSQKSLMFFCDPWLVSLPGSLVQRRVVFLSLFLSLFNVPFPSFSCFKIDYGLQMGGSETGLKPVWTSKATVHPASLPTCDCTAKSWIIPRLLDIDKARCPWSLALMEKVNH